MSLKDRINELSKEFPKKKPAHLARFANISRSAVSDWMNGNTQTISGRNAFVVARFFPNVSPEWVQAGKGKKYISRAEGLGIGREVPLISWMQAGACCGANGDYASNAESWWTCPVPHGRNT